LALTSLVKVLSEGSIDSASFFNSATPFETVFETAFETSVFAYFSTFVTSFFPIEIAFDLSWFNSFWGYFSRSVSSVSAFSKGMSSLN
jgi:hypothetical protein